VSVIAVGSTADSSGLFALVNGVRVSQTGATLPGLLGVQPGAQLLTLDLSLPES
jgi:hypothetical protein